MTVNPREHPPETRNGHGGPAEAHDVHPEPPVLAGYLDGELEAADAEAVERHLESCPECSLLLQGYPDPEELKAAGREEVVAEELSAALSATRRRLGVAPSPRGAARSPDRDTEPLPVLARAGRGFTWALAAGLLLAVVVATLWGMEQRRDLQALRHEVESLRIEATVARGGPVGLVVLDDPGRVLRSAGGVEQRVEVAAGPDLLGFVLAYADGPEGPYRVVIRGGGAEGPVLWRGTVPGRQPGGQVAFLVPGDDLADGSYRLLLSPAAGEAVAYPFRLVRVER